MTAIKLNLHEDDFFHARPAAVTAAAAKRFESVMMVALGTELADGKDAMSLMRLSHPRGRTVDLIADGPDETAALNAVSAAIRQCFELD
ncbi:MAG: HPr family phosphocarrier protein [Clostridiales bacterium]|nr:HPr family phosphocarrier protein [Clostridiales bacterium]